MDEKYGVKYLFANVNGERRHISQVESGDLGLCPLCNGQLRAYHGEKNQWHWRHVDLFDCDPWHEGKTPWHKDWQDKFPLGWQEVAMRSETERHFADVKTSTGTVIEFQHSSMDRDTRQVRERFYGNMLWVVDGDAKKRTFERMRKNLKDRVEQGSHMSVLNVREVEKILPEEWCESDKLVLFDFKILPWMLALCPEKALDGRRIIYLVKRDEFVSRLTAGQSLFVRSEAEPRSVLHRSISIVPMQLRPQAHKFISKGQYFKLKRAGYNFRGGRF